MSVNGPDLLSSLPVPGVAALAHSRRLAHTIRESIRTVGGRLPFDRFMEAALYAPGLGYYAAGTAKFGSAGDFITAPEIGSLFGRCIASQVAEIFEQLGRGALLEAGPGSGRLLADVLDGLADTGSLPESVLLLEPSPDLRERQRVLLRRRVPDYFPRLHWISDWPQGGFEGVILANEVIDAMPVTRFRVDAGRVVLAYVVSESSGFGWSWHKADAPSAERLIARYALSDGYMTEVNERATAWVEAAAECLHRGVMLLIDYGFPGPEFYHVDRREGTLMCHYRHHAHGDPFLYPGLQDITAHVDFSAIAAAAVNSRLEVAGYASQAAFLLSLGLLERAAEMADTMAAAREVKYLTLPSDTGELFKVIALSRDIVRPLKGFSLHNRSGIL